jgi:hypothetical protein
MSKTIDMPLCYFGEGHSPKLRRGEREDGKRKKRIMGRRSRTRVWKSSHATS